MEGSTAVMRVLISVPELKLGRERASVALGEALDVARYSEDPVELLGAAEWQNQEGCWRTPFERSL
jgi:hypothetical protein